MAKNVNKIAKALGAKVGETLSDTGGGAFGMAWLSAELSRASKTYSRQTPRSSKRPIVGLFSQGAHERGYALSPRRTCRNRKYKPEKN